MSEPAIILLTLALAVLAAATAIALFLLWLVLGSPLKAWAKLVDSITLLLRELQRGDAMRIANAAGAWSALFWVLHLALTADRDHLLQHFILSIILLVIIVFYLMASGAVCSRFTDR